MKRYQSCCGAIWCRGSATGWLSGRCLCGSYAVVAKAVAHFVWPVTALSQSYENTSEQCCASHDVESFKF